VASIEVGRWAQQSASPGRLHGRGDGRRLRRLRRAVHGGHPLRALQL